MAIIEHAKYYDTDIRNVSHTHTSCEVIFLMQGTLHIATEQDELVLHENDMLLIKSGQHHQITVTARQAYRRCIAFINPWALKKQLVRPDLFALLTDRSEQRMICVRNCPQVKDIFDEMTEIFLMNCDLYAELGTVLRLLSVFYRTAKLEQKPVAKSGKRLSETVRCYLEEHFAENVKVSQLARQHFVSEGYLTHTFKLEIGMSPRAYLTHIRCTRAYDLIVHTNMKFADISNAAGFCCANDMSRKIKENYGVTPTVLRYGNTESARHNQTDKQKEMRL